MEKLKGAIRRKNKYKLYKCCSKTQCVNIRYALIKRGKTIRVKKGKKRKGSKKKIKENKGGGGSKHEKKKTKKK